MSSKRKSSNASRSQQLQQAHKQAQGETSQMNDIEQQAFHEFTTTLPHFAEMSRVLRELEAYLILPRPGHVSQDCDAPWHHHRQQELDYLDYFSTNPLTIQYHASQRVADFAAHQPSMLDMLYAQHHDNAQFLNGAGSGSMIDHLLLGRANLPLDPGEIPIQPGSLVGETAIHDQGTRNNSENSAQPRAKVNLLGLTTNSSTPAATQFTRDPVLRDVDYRPTLEEIATSPAAAAFDPNILYPKPEPSSLPTDIITQSAIRKYLDQFEGMVIYDEAVIEVLQSLTTSLVVDEIAKRFKSTLHRFNLPSKYLPTIPNAQLSQLVQKNLVNKAQQVHSSLANDPRVLQIVKNDPNNRRKRVLSSFLHGNSQVSQVDFVRMIQPQSRPNNLITAPKIINSPAELPLIIISDSHQ